MTYQEFNLWSYEYFVSNNIYFDNIILSIDYVEFELEFPDRSLLAFKELNKSWNALLTPVNDIPQYFGLILLQCYAATQMERDEERRISRSNYTIHLAKLLGLDDHVKVQNLFREKEEEVPIQILIWESAKQHFKEKFNIDLLIPNRKNYHGKYIQYPKSQVLINKEDLKYLQKSKR